MAPEKDQVYESEHDPVTQSTVQMYVIKFIPYKTD